MSEKIFSKPVRVNDFIANTVNLSNENMGIYWRLLCYSWESKAMLCNNEEDIYEITKAYNEEVREKVDKIISKYFIPYEKFKLFINEVLENLAKYKFSENHCMYIKKHYLNVDSNCYFQKAQWLEWVRVNGNFISQSNAGKIGGQSKANQNSNESEALIPILKPILTPILKLKSNNYINKKIKYSVSFEKFWGKGVDDIKNRSTKSDTFKQWSKLSEEDKKDLREKWDHYKDSKGDYYKACERFLAKRIFEEISLGEKVVEFDPLQRIKGYVAFVKRKQHIPSISKDMVDTMLKEGWISQEEYDNW